MRQAGAPSWERGACGSIKRAIDACCLVAVAPCGLVVRARGGGEPHSEAVFAFWAQCFALAAGTARGVRAARVLPADARSCAAAASSSGSARIFCASQERASKRRLRRPVRHRSASARLRRGCLIGSRASIISGTGLHWLDARAGGRRPISGTATGGDRRRRVDWRRRDRDGRRRQAAPWSAPARSCRAACRRASSWRATRRASSGTSPAPEHEREGASVPRCDALDWMKAIGHQPDRLRPRGARDDRAVDAADLPQAVRRRVLPVCGRLHAGARAADAGRGVVHRGCFRSTCSAWPLPSSSRPPASREGPASRRATTCRSWPARTWSFDNFPANPTTWYLGTYIHALLLWACWLSRHRLGAGAIVVALAVEITARMALLTWVGPFVAYMALTNWLGVFAVGSAAHGHRVGGDQHRRGGGERRALPPLSRAPGTSGRTGGSSRLFVALAGAIVVASGASYYLNLSPIYTNLVLGFILANSGERAPRRHPAAAGHRAPGVPRAAHLCRGGLESRARRSCCSSLRCS